MKYIFKITIISVVSVVIGLFILTPVTDVVAKFQNPCLHLFNEYSSLFNGVSPDDELEKTRIVLSDKANIILDEFISLDCPATINEWADDDLQTKIALNQAGIFDT